MADTDIKSGLKNLAHKVGEAIQDLASLEVTTYSGDFTLHISDIKEEGQDAFKIKSLMQSMQAGVQSKLNLVAYSRFEIDSDASNIVRQNLGEEDKMLIEVHKEMVKAAQEARASMFSFAKELLKLNI
jgi:hypothetical protein